MISPSRLCLAGTLVSAALIGAALVFQYGYGLEPCPLCIVQRWFVIAVGAVLLAALLHRPRVWGWRLYGAGVALLAALGALVAARQVWLQYFATGAVGGCGVGLDYMLENFPLVKTVTLLWAGTSDCASVTWSFLGLSMAAWMVVFFLGFVGVGALLAFRSRAAGATTR